MGPIIKDGVMKNYTYTLDSAVLRNTEKHHFSAYITCNGNQCENWWPPRESGYTPMGMTYDAKLSCVIMDGNTIEHLTTLCIYGEPTFTYNNYNIKETYNDNLF